MTRITTEQTFRVVLNNMSQQRESITKYSDELSTGYKAMEPGDSRYSGTISRFRELISRMESYENRIAPVRSMLTFQEDVLTQANELVVRAKEIAVQAANESNSEEARSQFAGEIYQIRDHLVSLANSTYQGRYIYAGTADNQPPYYKGADYTTGTGKALEQYVFATREGISDSKNVKVSDDMTIQVNTSAYDLFENAIDALETLGRSVSGYSTNPDGTYTFPDDYDQQTTDIQGVVDSLDSVLDDDLSPEIGSLAGRQRRLSTAESILDLSKVAAQEALSQFQDADMIESATNLSQAETSLQASLAVTAKILGQSLLDYI